MTPARGSIPCSSRLRASAAAALVACFMLSACALFSLMGRQYRLGGLHQEGRYAEAVPVAVELLELTEKE